MAQKLLAALVKAPGIAILKVFDFLAQNLAGQPPLLTEQDFPLVKMLPANREKILEEYLTTVRTHTPKNVKDFYKVDTDINYDDNWKAAPLILFGYKFNTNALLYPETFRVLDTIPGCAGAMFSVLGPWKHIPPHRGIYKGVYRCLFTLQVAEGADCWIKVNNEKIYFETGKSILFDETAVHEVMNNSNSPRIVLYLDIYRKLPLPLNFLNDMVFGLLRRSPFVKNILHEYAKLETTSFEDYKWAKPTLS